MARFICHCDDCQAVHGAPYPSALFPAAAVAVVGGETEDVTLKTTPRTKCKRCRSYLFAEVPGYGVRGVNGGLFHAGAFIPEFHVQCRFSALPIEDELPHYKGNPARFYGSDEQMQW
ncbi:MAG: GFA family protein [Rhizobacter sp.]